MRDPERAWLTTLIDVQEGRPPVPLLNDVEMRELLAGRPRIAMVGASADPGRPSHGVFTALRAAGYDVVPINPGASAILGVPCFPTLADAVSETGPVDLVDVFRRPDRCVEAAIAAVAVGARCLWLQLGIANAEAGRIAHDAGLSVVMDRCTIVEHRRLVTR